MMANEPDRLFIDKNDREFYKKIKREIFEGFFSKEAKDQFILAMAFGFAHKGRCSLDSRDGFFRSEYLQQKDEALINAIAIFTTDSIEVLSNKEEVYKIAEEYAHGGIRLLYEEVTSGMPGSFFLQAVREENARFT